MRTGDNRSRSPSLDRDRRGGSDLYLPNSGDSYGGRLTRSMRQAHEHAQSSNLSLQNPYHQPPASHNLGPQYPSLFPNPPPSEFAPSGAFDGPPRYGHHAHEPQYDPALYQQQQPPLRQAGEFVPVRGSQTDREQRLREALLQDERERERGRGGDSERRGGDMFAAFLEADEQSRQMAAAQRQLSSAQQSVVGGSGLDWPSAPARTGSGSGDSSSARGLLDVPNPNPTPSTSSWFDMFTSGASGSSAAAGSNLNSLGEDVAHVLGPSGRRSADRAPGGTAGKVGPDNRDPSDNEDADGEDDVEMDPSGEQSGGGTNTGNAAPENGTTRPTRSRANRDTNTKV